jgi:hypothetical protein
VQLATGAVAKVGSDRLKRSGGVGEDRNRSYLCVLRVLCVLCVFFGAGAPGRIAADTLDAELGGESQMLGKLVRIHGDDQECST